MWLVSLEADSVGVLWFNDFPAGLNNLKVGLDWLISATARQRICYGTIRLENMDGLKWSEGLIRLPFRYNALLESLMFEWPSATDRNIKDLPRPHN
jgi:hypothetical protein